MTHTNIKRREFLKTSALGLAATGFPGILAAKPASKTRKASSGFNPDVEIEFVSRFDRVPIFNGKPTQVQKYHAKLLKGPASTLTTLPDNYLGPILNLVKGQKVRVIYSNELAESSIIHWHGLHVPQYSDGHPMYSIRQGEQYVYEFEVANRAGTSFYHSHSHELTAEQVYHGLAGMITVADDEEAKLDLPTGEFDLPFVIQDRTFTQNNQLRYVHGMHNRMLGFLGETILINGKPDAQFDVKSRVYRFRALNGSNSRIYKLGWDDGTPLTAIGTDGCILEKPETRPYIMLAPGERVDLWLDFSGRKKGEELVMYSLPYSGAMPPMYERMGGGRGGMMAHSRLKQGAKFPLARFKVTEQVSDSPRLPERLVPFQRLTDKDVDNASHPLPIAISMKPMRPQLNGLSFSMDRVIDSEKVPLGSFKKIRIFHDHGMAMGKQDHESSGGKQGMRGGMMGGGMMMSMAHPIHLHGQQYQIVSRKMEGMRKEEYATVKDGFIDSGWKDTVIVMPGEEIEIIKPFQDYKGLFLYHCHNLEHEDLGMMRQFYVY
jgi:blue copper oxidase